MTMPTFGGGLDLKRLKSHRCTRVYVADSRALQRQKTTAAAAAIEMGFVIYTSYRHPWLYVRLGERTRSESVVSGL